MRREEYDRMATLEATMWWFRALHAELLARLEHAALPPRSRVLDAGCGTGGFLVRLAAARPDLLPEGLELDDHAAAIAREKTGLSIAEGSVAAMPYPSGSFSAIVSADVLCHAGVDERAALAEFRRCLEPGGFLLLNLPAYEWLTSLHDERVHNARRYSATGARGLVSLAGFSNVRVAHWNGLLLPFMLLHRLGLRHGEGSSDVRVFPSWQDRLFFAVTRVERRLSAAGFPMPFGGSLLVEARK
jgi:SAM-dependent methyltransferase